MIPEANVGAYMEALSLAVDIPHSMAEQDGEKSDYPFISWKMLSVPIMADHRHGRTYTQTSGQETDSELTLRRSEISGVNLSITVFDKDDFPFAEANEIRRWIISYLGRTAAATGGFVASILSQQIEPRSVQFDQYYERAVGFDVALRSRISWVEEATIEQAEAVTIGVTVEDEEKEDLLVGTPV